MIADRFHVVRLALHHLMKTCRNIGPELDAIGQLNQGGFEDCRKLGRTRAAWPVEIGRMWRFSRSNGITEGFHRQMKLIQRRAFGFRNFENYRRRVRALCA